MPLVSLKPMDNRRDGLGFYGKVPSHGDFLQRRLARDFVEPWDLWLQGGVTASRNALGAAWLDIYLTSPLWRFALPAGVCGRTGMVGLMMPSVDRVGRYFPFTIAAPLSDGILPAALTLADPVWFEQAETIMLTALEDGFDLEAFESALAALALPKIPSAPRRLAPGPLGWHASLDAANRVEALLPALITERIGEMASLWWTQGSRAVAPSLIACPGLPSAAGFAAFLDGRWSHWEWSADL